LASSLESLLAEGVISEIYGRLKSGKEADVFAVCYGDTVVAAKVYKDRAQRSFKSNSTYKEGRAVRNSRSQRAMDRGSKFGQETAEDAWKSAEATALYKLHAAGVRVPVPVMFLEGVLFMELVRGSDGQAAPRLIDTQLDATQARDAYMDMLGQLVRILSCDLIHGDLSPYNVLWAESGPTLIDFPQIVSAAQNSNSESFFHRDARNILGHFAAIDPSLRGRVNSDAREIWRAYVRRELSPDFLPTGQAQRAEPRPHVAQLHENRPREERQTPRGPNPRRPSAHANDRGPNDRGPQQNRGPNDRGPQQNRGPNDRGPQQNRGPNDRGPQQNRGPNERGSQQNRGPNERGSQQNRGPQQNHGPQQNRGPLLHMASPQANLASHSGDAQRPQQQRPQQQRPQQQRPQQQRPQQQRRGPEVIVLKRRAPEATAPAEREPAPSAQASERASDPARRRRR
jgi:RIO kinase 1